MRSIWLDDFPYTTQCLVIEKVLNTSAVARMTQFCVFSTALWLGQGESILTRTQQTDDIDMICCKMFPINAITCSQVGPMSLEWPVVPPGWVLTLVFHRRGKIQMTSHLEYERACWIPVFFTVFQGKETQLLRSAYQEQRHHLFSGNSWEGSISPC